MVLQQILGEKSLKNVIHYRLILLNKYIDNPVLIKFDLSFYKSINKQINTT